MSTGETGAGNGGKKMGFRDIALGALVLTGLIIIVLTWLEGLSGL